MKLEVFPTEVLASEALADRIVQAVAAKPELVLTLPTGRTPLTLYRALVARHRAGQLDFAKVRTFNLDEFVGLPPHDPASFRAYMERHLFAHVNAAPERIGFLDGTAPDLDAECARYEQAIADAGGIDLAVLGLGANGHVAFNEPDEGLIARTHRARLTRGTREANSGAFGGDPTRVPLEALTMGIGTILQARELALVAFGAAKAEPVRRIGAGPVTPRFPASFLQLHPRVTLYLDAAAGR